MEIEQLKAEQDDCEQPDWAKVGISFENVKFGYEDKTLILKGVSFEIESGESIGLVGVSGAGKTTIIRLMLALINSNSGNISFKNELEEKIAVCAASRKLISYVPQGNTLFSGSIADNLFKSSSKLAEKDIELALRTACAWDFVKKLPEGIFTEIGERGYGLSEGQAQRISIARALLQKTPIIIFDEATSQLDLSTELKVLKGIRELTPARTCIIISHRQETLNICDRVLKLEEGRLS